MLFIRLGFTNAWRSLARSLMAILSMTIAAGFMTYSISLSRGYAGLYKADCRSIIGGEIVVYARQFGGVIPEGESRWQHNFLFESPFTDLSVFRPELLKRGYLSSEQQSTAFSDDDVAIISSEVTDLKAVYPRYQLPAVTLDAFGRRSTPLHGRDAHLDGLLARHPQELVTDGRWFTEEDEGQLVAVISAVQSLPVGSRVPTVGEKILIALPRIAYIDGEMILKEDDPLEVELTIVGQIEAVTRFLGTEGSVRPILWEMNEIQIPLATWQTLWQKCGGAEYFPEQISLVTESFSYVEDTVAGLRKALPRFTFYGAPEHFGQAEQRGLIEKMDANIAERVIASDTQAAMPLDMRLPFTILIFANSAFVVASNLLIMVSERRKEIGVLKAVGASRPQIILMILGEALLISLVGTCFGFVFFQIPVVLNKLTNHLGMTSIVGNLLSDASLVYGASLLFAAIFGLLPGLRMARLSVMEVMRYD